MKKKNAKPSKKPVAKKAKAIKKVRSKSAKSVARASGKRGTVSKKKVPTRKKPVQKVSKVSSVSLGRKQKSKSVDVSKKRKRSTPAKKTPIVKRAKGKATRKKSVRAQGKVIYSKRRGNKQIDFTFQGVKAIDKKKILFSGSKEVADKITRMVKLKGKPPRGVVIIVQGKKLNEDGSKENAQKTIVSPLDFVVNTKNVLAFVDGVIEKMESDFEEWLDMEGEPGDGDTDQYGTYDPDTISGISIKFIY